MYRKAALTRLKRKFYETVRTPQGFNVGSMSEVSKYRVSILLIRNWADANFDTQPYMTYQNGCWFTRVSIKWFWSNYLTNQTNVKDPTISPLQVSIEQLKGLPPTLVINGENDVLCDEVEAYALKLLEAGVPVTEVPYRGLFTTL